MIVVEIEVFSLSLYFYYLYIIAFPFIGLYLNSPLSVLTFYFSLVVILYPTASSFSEQKTLCCTSISLLLPCLITLDYTFPYDELLYSQTMVLLLPHLYSHIEVMLRYVRLLYLWVMVSLRWYTHQRFPVVRHIHYAHYIHHTHTSLNLTYQIYLAHITSLYRH